MDRKSKKSKRRKVRDSHGSYGNSPIRGSFPSPLPPGMAPYPDFDLFLAMHEELKFRIASDCNVHIQFKGIATQAAVRKLINYLEMVLVDFPKNKDSSPTQE